LISFLCLIHGPYWMVHISSMDHSFTWCAQYISMRQYYCTIVGIHALSIYNMFRPAWLTLTTHFDIMTRKRRENGESEDVTVILSHGNGRHEGSWCSRFHDQPLEQSAHWELRESHQPPLSHIISTHGGCCNRWWQRSSSTANEWWVCRILSTDWIIQVASNATDVVEDDTALA
jgi:hypothetical protein